MVSKTHFEIELEMCERAFGKTFLGDLHQLDIETGGENVDITENFIFKFIEKRIGEEKFRKAKEKKIFSPHFRNQIFHMYHFFKYGKKIFHFEENLTKMLLKTDLRNIDTEFLKIPFQSIYISLTHGSITKEINGKNYSLIGIYVYDFPTDSLEEEVLKSELGEGINKLIRIQAILSLNENVKMEEPMFALLNLRFKPGNLFEQLEDNYKRTGFNSLDSQMSDEIVSFVVNAIFYLNSDKRVVELIEPEFQKALGGKKSSKKKKKLERKYENKIKLPYYQVGKSVIIDNKFSEKQQDVVSNKSDEQRVYNTQWIVRGHWRNQAYGEGMKQRKLIWIKPYLKGNETGPLRNAEYRVK